MCLHLPSGDEESWANKLHSNSFSPETSRISQVSAQPKLRYFVWIWFSKVSVAKNPGINTRSFGIRRKKILCKTNNFALKTRNFSFQKHEVSVRKTRSFGSKPRSFGLKTRSSGSKTRSFELETSVKVVFRNDLFDPFLLFGVKDLR
jgi:hypothetical protein